MSQAAHKNQATYSITVLNGPDKGTVYKLMGGQISLGRGSDSDIVIKGDPKCSRLHANIKVTSNGVEIFDVSQKNVITVDGNVGSNQFLQHDSVILLGRTKLRFKIEDFDDGILGGTNVGIHEVTKMGTPDRKANANQQMAPMPEHAPQPLDPPMKAGGVGPARPKRSRRKKRHSQEKSSLTFYIIIGVIGLVAYLLFGTGSNKSKEKITLRSDDQIIKEIQSVDSINTQKAIEFSKKGFKSPQYKAAQSNFVKGRRDYQKGQYGRALVSFQACLGLFPKHELCAIYKRLSEKKSGEMIQYQMVLGRKYKEQNQYSACVGAFRNVMNMLEKDTTSIIYKEARANAIQCQRELEDDF